MQWIVTGVTLAGFGLATVGALRVYLGARRQHSNMERTRRLRDSALATLRAERAAAAEMPRPEGEAAEAAAQERWTESQIAAGIEPWTLEAAAQGREFLAEEILRESAAASRADLALVAVGLLIGLVATLMDIWLL